MLKKNKKLGKRWRFWSGDAAQRGGAVPSTALRGDRSHPAAPHPCSAAPLGLQGDTHVFLRRSNARPGEPQPHRQCHPHWASSTHTAQPSAQLSGSAMEPQRAAPHLLCRCTAMPSLSPQSGCNPTREERSSRTAQPQGLGIVEAEDGQNRHGWVQEHRQHRVQPIAEVR